MQLIKANNQKIALKFSGLKLKEGLSFFTEDQDFIQVGAWKYPKGKKLLAHQHQIFKREAKRTQEFIYLLKGSLKAVIYDEDKKPLESLILNADEGLILFAGGHGYEILQEDTQVIEVKNGPYAGAKLDRQRLEEDEE